MYHFINITYRQCGGTVRSLSKLNTHFCKTCLHDCQTWLHGCMNKNLEQFHYYAHKQFIKSRILFVSEESIERQQQLLCYLPVFSSVFSLRSAASKSLYYQHSSRLFIDSSRKDYCSRLFYARFNLYKGLAMHWKKICLIMVNNLRAFFPLPSGSVSQKNMIGRRLFDRR